MRVKSKKQTDSKNDDPRMKELAMIWKRAAPLLRAQRHKDIRRQNNEDAIRSLSSFCQHALTTKQKSKTSGFVQMYEVLKRSINQ